MKTGDPLLPPKMWTSPRYIVPGFLNVVVNGVSGIMERTGGWPAFAFLSVYTTGGAPSLRSLQGWEPRTHASRDCVFDQGPWFPPLRTKRARMGHPPRMSCQRKSSLFGEIPARQNADPSLRSG